MVTSSWPIPLYIRIKITCHIIKSLPNPRTASVDINPTSAAILKLNQNDITRVWRWRCFGNGISSPRDLNCIKSISMRHLHYIRSTSECRVSTFIKKVYLRRLFRFRSTYLSTVELPTSFQQPNSIVADIEAIAKWHFRLGFAGMNSDIYIEWPTWN